MQKHLGKQFSFANIAQVWDYQKKITFDSSKNLKLFDDLKTCFVLKTGIVVVCKFLYFYFRHNQTTHSQI
jgi:hypothetical protein